MKLTTRHLFRGKGAHRAPAAPPARPYGAVATQAIRPCPPCGGDVPVVLHQGAHRCDRGHLTVTATQEVAS